MEQCQIFGFIDIYMLHERFETIQYRLADAGIYGAVKNAVRPKAGGKAIRKHPMTRSRRRFPMRADKNPESIRSQKSRQGNNLTPGAIANADIKYLASSSQSRPQGRAKGESPNNSKDHSPKNRQTPAW